MNVSDWRYHFRCPCGMRIHLPRQSSLGIFANRQSQPTGEWPVTFLCLECGRLSAISHEKLPGGPYLHQNQYPRQCLWKIDCKCVCSNCESQQRLYVFYSEVAQPQEVIDTAISMRPSATCESGHEMELDETSATAECLPL